MRKLEFGRRAALAGKARSLVVFVHGYGADGADLLGLADPLGPHLPNTVFVSPNAPDACPGNPLGYQWFPIPWLDGSSQAAAEEGLDKSARDLDGFLDAMLAAEGLTADRMALVGFSQGTMISLHVAPRRPLPIAGVVGFSGRLLRPDILGGQVVSRPPVLLIHGDADQVVPYGDMAQAAETLDGAGIAVVTHTSPGMGHGIGQDGLGLALQFLLDRLPG